MSSSQFTNLKVALVYDRVNTPFGGAERVLLSLQKLFPTAPLYTSVYDAQRATWSKSFTVRSSWLNRFPLANRFHRQLLPIMPLAFAGLDLSEFDLVISVTSAEAKYVKVSPKAVHVSYLLSPPRYLWSHFLEYQLGKLKLLKAWTTNRLRATDFLAAHNTHHLIPISNLVRQRAKKYYRRLIEPTIYPPFHSLPVSTPASNELKSPYWLMVSRLVSYKRIDLAIKAAIKLQQRLVIVGTGPDKSRLLSLIKKNQGEKRVHFIDQVSETELASLYARATATLVLAEEDFGITALESQSLGTPVIVYYHSGAAETIEPDLTGILLKSQQVTDLIKAMKQIQERTWDRQKIKQQAEKFSEQIFLEKFEKKVTEILGLSSRA